MRNLFVVIIITVLAQVCQAGETSFSYSTGSPLWSYIAQGSNSVSPTSDWVFSLLGSSNHDYLGLEITKNLPGDKDYQYWYIHLQNTNNSPLTNGSYVATRWPFQEPGVAGFSWSGNGRGNNTLTAIVQIMDIQNQENVEVPSSVAIDFTQFEETWDNLSPSLETNKWSAGSIRFNSSIAPSTVPEPNTVGLLLVGALIVFISILISRLKKPNN